jgi:hypothetical protein
VWVIYVLTFNFCFPVPYWIFVLQRDLWWLFVICAPPPPSLYFAPKYKWICSVALLCLFYVFRAVRDRCSPVLWSWVLCRPIVYSILYIFLRIVCYLIFLTRTAWSYLVSMCTVTCMSDYERGLHWWLYLLPSFTLPTRDHTLQIIDTHRLVFSVYYSLH